MSEAEKAKITRRKYLMYGGGIVVVAVVGAAGYYAGTSVAPATPAVKTVTSTVTATATPTPTPTPTPTALPPLDEWIKEVSKPFSGTTLKLVTESTPSSLFYRDVIAPKFTALTGIKIDFEAVSWDEMYRKSLLDMERGTGIYDITYNEQDVSYMYYVKKYTVNLRDIWKDHPELVRPDYDPDDILILPNYTWGPEKFVLAIPFEGYVKTVWYRTDWFTDPTEMANFKKKYGWDLRPAKTWDEYEQIAEFFYRPDKKMYGHTEQAKAHACAGYGIVESYFPTFGVQSHGLPPRPIVNWGINLDTKGASVAKGGLVNSEQGIKCMETMTRLLKYAPPGVREFTWTETAEAFASGIVAQGFFYSEFQAVFLDPARSTIVGKCAPALPPVDPKYHDFGKDNIGYFDMGGWNIPHSAKNPLPAWLFIEYMSMPETDFLRATQIGTVTRTSTLKKLVGTADDEKRGNYWTLLDKSKDLFWGAPPLASHLILIEIYWTNVAKMYAGEITPKACAETIAKAVDAKLAELGYV